LLELSIRIRSTDLPGGFERKYCSAALLDDQRTALTSAHCLDDDIASYDAVDVVYRVAGETRWRLRATSFRLHRLWDIDDQSLWPTTDIALVALADPVVVPQGAAIGYELRSAPFEIWGAQFDRPALTPTLYRCLPARGEYEIAPAGVGVSLTARCGLQPGASGGPFLQMLETGPVVVGVLSRYSDSGRNFSTSMDAFTDVEANFTPPRLLPG
jgi:secreted trypsin-like serine protease